MKIHISYDPEEKDHAGAVFAALVRRLPGARIHENVFKAGKYHIYLTTKKSEKS